MALVGTYRPGYRRGPKQAICIHTPGQRLEGESGLSRKGVSPGVAPQPPQKQRRQQQQARLTIGNSPRRYLPRRSQIPSHPRLPGLTSSPPLPRRLSPRPGPAEPASPRASEAFYYSPDNTLTLVPLTLVPLAGPPPPPSPPYRSHFPSHTACSI